jgi:hypothetical protein
MADLKISALTASTTPLAGTEVLPIVQSATTKQVSVANLTAGRSISATGLDITGTASRITADFSSSTNAGSDRTSFQSSTTNGNSIVNVIPNGTGTSAQVRLFGNSTLTNASMGQMILTGTTEFRIAAQIAGTGTYVPINFYTNNAKQFEILTSGNVAVTTGNLVIGTSGKGIDFSATAGTGTSELLADYEEGDWTPSVTSSSGSITTVGTVTGKYTKTGNVVTLFARITITTNGTGSGSIVVAGLPYSPSTSVSAYSGYGRERSVSGKQLQVDFTSAGSSFEVYNYDNTYPASNGATLIFTVLYIAA